MQESQTAFSPEELDSEWRCNQMRWAAAASAAYWYALLYLLLLALALPAPRVTPTAEVSAKLADCVKRAQTDAQRGACRLLCWGKGVRSRLTLAAGQEERCVSHRNNP